MPASCRPVDDTPPIPESVSQGHLLAGRVCYAQPLHGFRSGIEPVLLAAAVPARPGERVLEGGSGAGAGLLCLAARVPGLMGVGVERDVALAALAARNIAANGWSGLQVVAADIAQPGGFGPFDHAFANPPYHAPDGTRSPIAAREAAKRLDPMLLGIWAAALAAGLRHRGTLTFILPASALSGALAALQAARCPAHAVLPLWPKPGRAAKLLLLQGVKGGRAPLRLLAGLTLHQADGGFTPAAEAILRDAAPLPFA